MANPQRSPSRPIATFSLVARDPETNDLGVVVASKFLAVGAVVPTAVAGVGAVATQSYANVSYGPRALAILERGGSPDDCLQEFEASDDNFQERQFGIVSATGASVTFTGSECHAWAGGIAGENFAAQGNILTGPDVVDALVAGVQRTDLPFPERLLEALAAADERGGDKRGRQSASLLVVGEGKGYGGLNDRWIDLRVDDHEDPVSELRRLLTLNRLYMDKPSEEPRQLSTWDIEWLQGLLAKEGYLVRKPTGEWDDETEQALAALFGVENLEERWVGGPAVDPVAWQYLEEKFG